MTHGEQIRFLVFLAGVWLLLWLAHEACVWLDRRLRSPTRRRH